MRAPALVAVVALAAVLSGCIKGAFFPAFLPNDQLAPGWVHDTEDSSGGEEGMRPLVVAKYQINTYEHSALPIGVVYVVSVSDVPILDEQAEIQKQLDAKLAAKGVTLDRTGGGTAAVGSDRAVYTLYNARVDNTDGRAVDVRYTCGANNEAVRVFGFASTQVQAVLGITTDLTTWEELVGRSPESALGGMVTRVRCG